MNEPLPEGPESRFATSADRVALARTTHRSVIRTMAIIYTALAAVVLGAGLLLIPEATSNVGVCVVVGAFLLAPLLFGLWVRRIERRAELFLAGDGVTLLRANAHGLTVAGVVLPYERITCLYGNVEQESCSDGGHRGEAMAFQLGMSDERPTLGRAIGGLIGTGQRRRLYADGAKSAIFLCIGVDRKGTLGTPKGVVEKVPFAPQRGEDPGRIMVPFGAYLGVAELELLLAFVREHTGGQLFPLGVVSGTLNWAAAQVGAADAREQIWADSAGLLAR